MVSEVTLDRRYYSKQFEIYDWLAANLGSGFVEDPNWTVRQAFGYTTIAFKIKHSKEQFQTWLTKTYPHLL